jgi:release factor glutamine methyltransferase
VTSFFQLYREGVDRLMPVSQEAEKESEVLFLSAFNLKNADFLAILNSAISDPALIDTFRKYISERCSGLPIAYILKSCEFMGRVYYIEPDVLIPRPETELIVEEATNLIKQNTQGGPPLTVLEMGVGSGIITLELSRRFPRATFHGWDISETAVNVSKKNYETHSTANVTWHREDFLTSRIASTLMREERCLLVSNPPYILTGDMDGLEALVKDNESSLALDGGPDGLDYLRPLVEMASMYGLPLVAEIGFGQESSVMALLETVGLVGKIVPDLAGIPRCLVISAL